MRWHFLDLLTDFGAQLFELRQIVRIVMRCRDSPVAQQPKEGRLLGELIDDEALLAALEVVRRVKVLIAAAEVLRGERNFPARAIPT